MYHIIYDGNCNLCVNLVRVLEAIDGGTQFRYAPMQDTATLAQFTLTPQDCELGMILIDGDRPDHRWQGSAAAEEIGRLLPLSRAAIDLYRALPGVKPVGDRLYEQVRDHRYALFGQRISTYQSAYPSCQGADCQGADRQLSGDWG